MNDAFYHTGGVPEEIWFDNMKVDRSRTQFSQVHLNDRFYSLVNNDAGLEQWSVVLFAPKLSLDRVYNHEFYDSTDLISNR